MSYERSRGPPRIEGMTSLKVDNLTYSTTVDDLKKVFREFGHVGDVYIPRDARTNQSRGFAFVRFYERRDAEDAMDRVDGSVLDGREIRVQHAKYGRPQSDYRQRSSRDRGYNDRRGRRSYSPRRRRSRSRSYSPKRRSRSPRNKRSRSRSGSPRRRQSRSPQPDRRRGSGSPSPKRTSRSPEQNGSPTRNRKSSSPEKSS